MILSAATWISKTTTSFNSRFCRQSVKPTKAELFRTSVDNKSQLKVNHDLDLKHKITQGELSIIEHYFYETLMTFFDKGVQP